MEEEHEDLVDNQSSPLPVPTTATTSSDNSGNSGTITGANTEERIQEQTTTAVSTGTSCYRSLFCLFLLGIMLFFEKRVLFLCCIIISSLL